MVIKKAEVILGACCLFGGVIGIAIGPEGNLFTMLPFSSLSVFYMFFSFPLLNSSISKIPFTKEPLLVGMGLAMMIIGIQFSLKSWPFSEMILKYACFVAMALLVFAWFKYSKTKEPYHKEILKRLAIYIPILIVFILTPKSTWIEMEYRDYPDYVSLWKEAYSAESYHQESWDKVTEARKEILDKE